MSRHLTRSLSARMLPALVASLALAVSGCGGDEETAAPQDPAASDTSSPAGEQTLALTADGSTTAKCAMPSAEVLATFDTAFEGTVTSIDIKVGETAVPSSVGIAGSNLLTIADLGTISTEVNVDEADIARIKVGQQAEINAAAFPDLALKGTVASIPLSPSKAAAGAAGASQARSYLVRIRLADPSSVVLRPGMSCRAEILTHTPGRALAVPVQALFTNDQAHASDGKRPAQEHHVFVDVEGRVERRAVIPGVSDDSHVEIRKGVKAGERVIVGPYKVLRHLRPGDEVDASGTSGARS